MKVIDLLNKIVNEEEVPVFKYEKHRYKYSKENKYFEDLDNDEYCKPDVFLVELNDEVEIIEDKLRFHCSKIPPWFDIKEVIRVVNINFEKQQKALYEIIDKINGE